MKLQGKVLNWNDDKGFGFVEMENNDEAKKAISGLNGATLKSRDITVNEARPRA